MKVIPLTREAQAHYAARVKALTPQSRAQWGHFEVRNMVAHLRRSLEISLGEVSAGDESTFFTRTLLRFVALSSLPIPKNAKAAPVFMPSAEGSLEAEKEQLLRACERFIEAAGKEPARLAPSPLFGTLSPRAWAKLHGKHLDHHLRQFSV